MGLVIEHVTKKFNDFTAVDDLNLNIPNGSMYGFLGGNGAGKTTTFRMILNLIQPTGGTIHYNDNKISYELTNKIGYLPEERGLHPKLKVDEQIQYLGQLKNLSKKEVNKRLNYWLDTFEVPENKSKRIEKLSKGNQQKIQVIASIIHNPELIILDEPFSGLDPVNVEILKKAIINLNKQGSTIIFSTHRMEHVEELCESLCILNKGKQIVSGKIRDIKADFGIKDLVIEGNHDLSFLRDFDGVIDMKHHNNIYTLKLENERVAQDIYQKVVPLGYFRQFQVKEPSLNDIFISKVGGTIE